MTPREKSIWGVVLFICGALLGALTVHAFHAAAYFTAMAAFLSAISCARASGAFLGRAAMEKFDRPSE